MNIPTKQLAVEIQTELDRIKARVRPDGKVDLDFELLESIIDCYESIIAVNAGLLTEYHGLDKIVAAFMNAADSEFLNGFKIVLEDKDGKPDIVGVREYLTESVKMRLQLFRKLTRIQLKNPQGKFSPEDFDDLPTTDEPTPPVVN